MLKSETLEFLQFFFQGKLLVLCIGVLNQLKISTQSVVYELRTGLKYALTFRLVQY
jgi:hypothetical protein